MEQIFKIIKPIYKNQYHCINVDIEVGTVIKRVTDVFKLMKPSNGILAEIPGINGVCGVPFEHIEPMFQSKKTIILLHGFNSGPGEKEQQVIAWLKKYNLADNYNVIAPLLHNNPIKAIKSVGYLILDNYGDVTLIGTSLGGFYANYLRSCNPSANLKVHAINPSWNPSETLKRELGKTLVNFKTSSEWFIDEKYLNRLHSLQNEIVEKLKNYKGNNYTVHLAKKDELLNFDKMLSYLDENSVVNKKFEYDTNHRFEKIEELLNNIKEQLV